MVFFQYKGNNLFLIFSILRKSFKKNVLKTLGQIAKNVFAGLTPIHHLCTIDEILYKGINHQTQTNKHKNYFNEKTGICQSFLFSLPFKFEFSSTRISTLRLRACSRSVLAIGCTI